jgi:hypothetical protein
MCKYAIQHYILCVPGPVTTKPSQTCHREQQSNVYEAFSTAHVTKDALSQHELCFIQILK